MKITVELDIIPFEVPTCVRVNPGTGLKQDGFKEADTIKLTEIDSITLSQLCDKFRNEVFKRANKQLPPTSA